MMDDSLDGGPPSVGSGEIPAAVNSILMTPGVSTSVSSPVVATPTPSSSKKVQVHCLL